MIAAELKAAGFSERGSGDFIRTIDRTEGVVGVVGLNKGLIDELGGHDVLVFVGVEHPLLADLYRELVPGEFFAGAVQNLAYLMSARGDGYWAFDPSGDSEGQAHSVVEAVIEYGLPFMQSLSDVRSLAAFMSESEGDDQRAWRLPPVLLLAGQSEEAQEIVQAELEAVPESGAWSDFYREFAVRFEAHIDRVRAMPDPPEPERRPPRVMFSLAAIERGLHIDEAGILEDWLWKTPMLAAQTLAARVRDAMTAENPEPLELDGEDVTALRAVLCGVDTGDPLTGLTILRNTVCGPAFASLESDPLT
jgi:hypothetical protein